MKLRKVLLTSAIVFTALPATANMAELNNEARAISKEFGGTLVGIVSASMKSSGPVETIAKCNETAPEIARELSQHHGWEIGRTSLKIRNPANQPDEWETRVLNSFTQRHASQEPINSLEYSEIVEADGTRTFRYMKAIGIKPACLQCHGSNEVKPETATKLKHLYPEDQARNYTQGDIRGAFTLTKQL